jgi:pimeloyl-ACP methyl ester carboxylesterase
MTTREHDVRLADGRTLRIQDSGATEAPTVVFCHGTPGCGLLHDRWLAAAAAVGLRLLAYDRPGYGGSPPQPDRSVADAAADVAALADQLQVDRFAVWGASGGGPHALACAALLPDRVVAAAVAPSPAPYDAPGLDWFAGMAETNIQRFKLALAGRDALQPLLAQLAQAFVAADPAQLIALSGPVLCRLSGRSSTPTLRRSCWPSSGRGWRLGQKGGSRMTWHSWRPGGWSWAACGCRWRCGMASRIWASRWLMAAGLPRRSRVLRCVCCPMMGTFR